MMAKRCFVSGSYQSDRKLYARLSMPDGCTRPYRPRPADFREVYIEMGWDGIDQHFGTNWRVIRRWIEEEGRDELRKARAEYVRDARRTRRKRYVIGVSLTAVKSGVRKG